MCRRMCVWLICRDVKLRRLFVFCFCRGHAAIMQTHANEAMHDGGSRGWSPWCTCIVVTTCCSGFASIQLSMSGDGKRLNPRTSKSIFFFTVATICIFAETMSPMYFAHFAETHIADCILIFSSISCRQCILMTFLDMETMQENFYYLKMHRWFLCFLSNLHVSGFSSFRITQMIHSCLVWFLWWLRHGAIGPIEATPVGVNVDWIDFRIYTFELVIRLSNVQQMALPFCAFDEVPRLLWSQGFLADAFLLLWSCSEHSETSFFRSNLCSYITWDRTQAGTRSLGVVFFLLTVLWWGQTYCAPNSLELESRLCLLWLTWTRAWSGTTHDF